MNFNINDFIIIALASITILAISVLAIYLVRKSQRLEALKSIETADNYYRNDEYDKGLSIYLKSLPYVEKTYGENSSMAADTFMKIGKSYIHLSSPLKAEDYIIKAKDHYDNLISSNPSEAASFYNTLGNLNESLKRYDAALHYYLKASEILESSNNENTSLAKCYLNIAIVYDNQKKYKKSVAMYRKAISIFEKDDQNIEKVIALSYFNLGVALYVQNKYESALECLEKSLIIRSKKLKIHPDIASCQHYIACVNLEMGKLDDAMALLIKSLKIKVSTLGNHHPEYWKTYFKLKNAYLQLGLAKEEFEKWVDEKLLESQIA